MKPFFFAATFCFAVSHAAVLRADVTPSTAATQVVAPQANKKQGPILSDQELFAAFNLDASGMAAVKAAVAGQDWTTAKAALLSYFRARPVKWRFNPAIKLDPKYSTQAAEDAVAGRVSVVTIRHEFGGGDINWFYNETKARADLPDNSEWQWQLNRMGFWNAMGRSYQATGDEKYAQAWAKQMRSWVTQAPRPDKQDNGAGSAWRTIETGIRMGGSWPNAWQYFLQSPSFAPDDAAIMLKSFVEQARYLRQFPTAGNWLTMEMSGLYTTGALFPELKDAAEWRAYATERLHQELKSQFLPDGAQNELSTGYHQVALDNVLRIPDIAHITGFDKELPPDYVSLSERAFAYDLWLMTPDRNLPRFNDSWPVNVPDMMRKAVEFFPQRTDFQWVASDGKMGTPPTETSHALPYAGYWAMRSGWERDANFAVLDAGPLGRAHVHQDKLNFVLWSYGREILYDSGGGSYEDSPYRKYATDTFGHNTVLVDGLPQRRQESNREANVSKAPIDAHWQSDAAHDFVQGVYEDGYGSETNRIATHTRRVLFLKPDVFLVADTLTPHDAKPHTYQARWHLLTTKTQRDATTGAFSTVDVGQSNLVIVPLQRDGLEIRDASAQTKPELLGWNVRKDTDPQYVPATTLLHTRTGTGVQTFLTLLLPIRAGETNPVQIVSALPNGVEVTLRDGRKLIVSADANPQNALSIRETRPDGTRARTAQAVATP